MILTFTQCDCEIWTHLGICYRELNDKTDSILEISPEAGLSLQRKQNPPTSNSKTY